MQAGVASFPATVFEVTVPIAEVDTLRTFAFAGATGHIGSTNFTADDNAGDAVFSVELASSTSLVIRRGFAGGVGQVGWFVVGP